jgi:hypothetical protein
MNLKKLRLLVDVLFFIYCLASILPFFYWGRLKDKLPIRWDALGQPIAWIGKGDALIQSLIGFSFLSFVYCLLRIQAIYPSFIRYGGRPTPKNIERIYRLGRTWTLILMLGVCILFIYHAYCDLNAYLFGFDTPLRAVMPSIFAIFLVLSLVSPQYLGVIIILAAKIGQRDLVPISHE